ncbi:MAG: DMP19 family protein [Paracoccaceae bacterium]
MSVEYIEYIDKEIRVADMAVDAQAFELGDISQILDPVRHSVETDYGETEYDASLVRFSRPQRLANAVMCYMESVKQQGHYQFFNSPDGIMWQDALTGLRQIGASKNVLILSGAALRVGGMPPFDCAKRQSMVSILKPNMDDLDTQYSKSDPLTALWSYMLTNRDAFTFRGQSAR